MSPIKPSRFIAKPMSAHIFSLSIAASGRVVGNEAVWSIKLTHWAQMETKVSGLKSPIDVTLSGIQMPALSSELNSVCLRDSDSSIIRCFSFLFGFGVSGRIQTFSVVHLVGFQVSTLSPFFELIYLIWQN